MNDLVDEGLNIHNHNDQLTYDLDFGLSCQPRPARPHANAAGVHAGVAVVGREQAERPVPQVVVAEGDRRTLDRRPVLRGRVAIIVNNSF